MKNPLHLRYSLATLVAASVLVAGADSQATTLLASNFEPPTYSVGPLVGQDGWFNEGGSGPFPFNVIANTIPGFGIAGTQTLEISGGSQFFEKNLSPSSITGGVWYFDFDILPNTNSQTSVFLDNAAFGDGVVISFLAGGQITSYNSQAGGQTVDGSYSNVPYHVTMKLDLPANTYDLYFDQNPTALIANASMRGNALANNRPIYAVELLTLNGSASDKAYLDNLVVSDVTPGFLTVVPEPSSVALLCACGALVWLRRRHA